MEDPTNRIMRITDEHGTNGLVRFIVRALNQVGRREGHSPSILLRDMSHKLITAATRIDFKLSRSQAATKESGV